MELKNKKSVIQIVLISLILLGSIIAYIGYNLNFKTLDKDIYTNQKFVMISSDLKRAIGEGINKVLSDGFNSNGILLYENYPYPISDEIFKEALINSINNSILEIINKYTQKNLLGKNYIIERNYTIKILKQNDNYILHIYNLSLIYHNKNIFVKKNLDPKLNLTDLFIIKNKINDWLNSSAYNFTVETLNLVNGSCGSGCSCELKKALLPEKPKFNRTTFYRLFNDYFSELNIKYFNNTNVYCTYRLGKVIFNENHGFEVMSAGPDTYCGNNVNKITTNYATNAEIWDEYKTIVDDMTLSYKVPNVEKVDREPSKIITQLLNKPTDFVDISKNSKVVKPSAYLNTEVYEPSFAMNAFVTCYYKRNTSLLNLPNKIFTINFAYRLNFIKLCYVKKANALVSKFKASLQGNCAKYEGCDENTGDYKFEYDYQDSNTSICNTGPYVYGTEPTCSDGTIVTYYTSVCKDIDNSICDVSYLCQVKQQNNGGQNTQPTSSQGTQENNNNNNNNNNNGEAESGSSSGSNPPTGSGGTTTGPVTNNNGNQNPQPLENTPPVVSPSTELPPIQDINFNELYGIS